MAKYEAILSSLPELENNLPAKWHIGYADPWTEIHVIPNLGEDISLHDFQDCIEVIAIAIDSRPNHINKNTTINGKLSTWAVWYRPLYIMLMSNELTHCTVMNSEEISMINKLRVKATEHLPDVPDPILSEECQAIFDALQSREDSLVAPN